MADPHHNLNNEQESSCFGLIQMDRSDSPEPSCVSMRSHQSLDPPSNFRKHSDLGSEPSCVSIRSHQSLDPPSNFNKQTDLGFRSDPPEPSGVSMKSHQSLDPPSNINKQTDLGFRSDPPEPSGVSMKSHQSLDPPSNFNKQTDLGFRSDPPEPSGVSMKSHQSLDPPSNFTGNNNLPAFRQDKQSRLKQAEPDCHSRDSRSAEVLNTYRSKLQKRFECLYEGIPKQGNPTLLKDIYTDLYITESESGGIRTEHEVRQIETQSRRTETEDKPIKCKDIFKALSEQDKPIRSVLTKGVAGIGKTVSVQKFILDWAKGKENKDVKLIFPLPFRELNLIKDQKLSLLELLHAFFPETKEMEISSGEYKVLFIFDGLDECRLSLDFHSSVRLCDVSESVSVDVMLTNLIAGNLLPSALIWITSRPAAADLIPSKCVDRVTEVRGFKDPQKDEYFRKRTSDESLNNRIISHLKSSRSLYIMCHIPVFCWISATVLERMLSKTKKKAKSEGEIPKSLTEMYTHFLIIQTNVKHQKDYEKNNEEMIFRLGRVAFEQLVKGNVIFYDEDLRDCGIDVAEASVYSGLCTQIFREEFVLYQRKVYCFVHLSIQEHLAALHVLLSFLLHKRDVLQEYFPLKQFTCDTISDLHQRAVDKALQINNGNLDLFVRFILGLSLESNQKLLQDLLTHTVNKSWSKEKTVEYIKNRIKLNPSLEKSINLFYCLNELGDQSLENEVQEWWDKSGYLSSSRFSSSQWSAVVFVLLTSEQLDVFELSKYVSPFNNKDDITSDTVLLKLLPVVKASRSAQLSDCKLSEKCFAGLTAVLTSNSSGLRDLNLSGNHLGDSGVTLLSAALKNPNCKLETLWLWDCGVTVEGCVALASALKSNPSHLRKLNLSGNKLGGSGVNRLLARLKNPSCKLEKLELSRCGVTDDVCEGLAAALISNSHLRDLNLSDNNLGSTGVKRISVGLENPNCKLEKLRLSDCGVTDKGCTALASALKSKSSNHLRELDLSRNKLEGSGVKLLSAGLKNPNCKLEKLVLWDCGITDKGCAALASALRSNSHLRELNLKNNKKLGDSGVKLLSPGLNNPNCKLEKLELNGCGVTDKGCVALASALKSNPSHLRELNLSVNNICSSGVKLLSGTLKNPKCKLEILRLMCCGITDEGCDALASALKSNPSHLRDLNLSENNLGDSGVTLLSAVLENPDCKLETLRLWDCGVTDEISDALRSNSHLKKLHLIGKRTTMTFRNEAAL